jgi:hypothetical protein
MHSQSDKVASTLRDTVSIAKRCLITEELNYLHASFVGKTARAFVPACPLVNISYINRYNRSYHHK